MVLVLFLVLGPDAGVSVPLCWGGDLALAAYQSYSTTGPRLLGWAGLGLTKEVMRAGDCEASLHLRASSGGQAGIN